MRRIGAGKKRAELLPRLQNTQRGIGCRRIGGAIYVGADLVDIFPHCFANAIGLGPGSCRLIEIDHVRG
ncbi:hypothetical protein SDC9_53781 [bioreactor metagenome]|uniref:Uncharacterized protein n=1 Tax=bioreactor metagenome TaxID=1076179 RepID=A0A644WU72_9ZZZZ